MIRVELRVCAKLSRNATVSSNLRLATHALARLGRRIELQLSLSECAIRRPNCVGASRHTDVRRCAETLKQRSLRPVFTLCVCSADLQASAQLRCHWPLTALCPCLGLDRSRFTVEDPAWPHCLPDSTSSAITSLACARSYYLNRSIPSPASPAPFLSTTTANAYHRCRYLTRYPALFLSYAPSLSTPFSPPRTFHIPALAHLPPRHNLT